MIAYNTQHAIISNLGTPRANAAVYSRGLNLYNIPEYLNIALSVFVNESKEFFIPYLYYDIYKNKIYKVLCTNPTSSFEISKFLYSSTELVAKTAESVIRTALNSSIPFICINTTKGYKYYGGNNIMLNNDFKPLYITGDICYIKKDTEGRSIEVKYPVCYIDPRVFSSKDMVSRFIINKMIPFIANSYVTNYDRGMTPIKIHIHSIDNIISIANPNLSCEGIDDIAYERLLANVT